MTLSGDVTVTGFSQVNGTIDGTGDLTITGSMSWTGGTQDGSGETIIAPGATATLVGNQKNLLRDLTNQGTLNWAAAGVSQPTGVTLTNAATGVFNIQLATARGWGGPNSGTVFDNQGTVSHTSDQLAILYHVFNNSGTVDVTDGTLWFRGGGTATGGEFTSNASSLLQFSNANFTFDATSSIEAENVVFTEGGTKTVEGTYTVTSTSVSNGIVNLEPSGGTIGSIALSGGTLNPPNRLELHGILTRTGGTYNQVDNTLAFVGATTQNLTLTLATRLNDLEVGAGTLLVETETPDHAILDGQLVNNGTVRKTRSVTGGNNTFGLTGVETNVSEPGSLTEIQVDRIDREHPNAFGSARTGRYWAITPTGASFDLDLTLVHDVSPDSDAEVCRFVAPATPWDCERDTSTPTTVTRNGVTQLSDWAVGDLKLTLSLMFKDGFEPDQSEE